MGAFNQNMAVDKEREAFESACANLEIPTNSVAAWKLWQARAAIASQGDWEGPTEYAAQVVASQGEPKPVAMVDAGDDGMFAEILPDVTVKVGQLLYTAPPAAAPAPDVDMPTLRALVEEMKVRMENGEGARLDWYKRAVDALAAAPAQAVDALPWPEMESLGDIAYAQKVPEDWDDDYKHLWQKFQVASRNLSILRTYARELRSALYKQPVQATDAQIIKPWQERVNEKYGASAYLINPQPFINAEIAELRAALAAQSVPALNGDEVNIVGIAQETGIFGHVGIGMLRRFAQAVLAAKPKAAPERPPLSRARIKTILLANGYHIPTGADDFRQYVYTAAYALLAERSAVILRAIAAIGSRMCNDCAGDACCAPDLRKARDELRSLLEGGA